LILVPTRELSEQLTAYLQGLLGYCDKEIVLANVASGTTTHLQRYAFAGSPCHPMLEQIILEHCWRIVLIL
jgi:ATP-dependent RNA helicase DDX56/DBP9